MSDHMDETTVDPDFDKETWDIVGSLALSKQLVSGDVLPDLVKAGLRSVS